MDNKSVTKITIRLENNLNHLQKIFPNLTDVAIRLNSNYDNNNQLAIKEIIKSKINKFTLFFNWESFPIFSNNCNEILDNLKIFHFKAGLSNKDILINLYNNINNMPNLEDFKIICETKIIIDENFYKDFISKILHLKFIRKVKIYLQNPKNTKYKEYTKEELQKSLPDLNLRSFFEISIIK